MDGRRWRGMVASLENWRRRRADPRLRAELFTFAQVVEASGLPGPVIMQSVSRTWVPDVGWMFTGEQLREAVGFAEAAFSRCTSGCRRGDDPQAQERLGEAWMTDHSLFAVGAPLLALGAKRLGLGSGERIEAQLRVPDVGNRRGRSDSVAVGTPHPTAEWTQPSSLAPRRIEARTAPQIRQFEYGGLPVNWRVFVIILSHNISHPWRRVGRAGQAK